MTNQVIVLTYICTFAFWPLLGVLEVLQASNSHLEKIHRCLEVSFHSKLNKNIITLK